MRSLPTARALSFPAHLRLGAAAREARERYGADRTSLYLIRPDGYVGFRCQPASAEALDAYLAEVVLPAG